MRRSIEPSSLAALALGFVPMAAICFSVPYWDRVHPMVLGLPFNLFWLIAWIVLTPIFMWGAYRIDAPRDRQGKR